MAIKWVNDKSVEVTSIEEYIQVIAKLTAENKSSKFIYRGQKDVNYLLNCGAARRFINSDHKEVTKEDLLEYHTAYLLENAKKIGLNFKDGREIKDMELIADLQHHGCATMFIDFSRNSLIALYFASQQVTKDNDPDGIVYVLRIDDTMKFLELHYEDISEEKCVENLLSEDVEDLPDIENKIIQESIKSLKMLDIDLKTKSKFYNKDLLFFWEPTHLNKRILTQQSIFVFGKPDIPEKDINLKIIVKNYNEGDNSNTDSVLEKKEKVSSNKELIHNYLKKYFNIDDVSLFNDLPGFSIANNQNSTFEITTKEYLIQKAREYFQRKQYKIAKSYFERYIRIDNNNPQIINEYGNVFAFCGYHEEAISQYSRAIDLDPNYARAYSNKGIAFLNIGDYNLSEINFDVAIKLGINDENSYYSRGLTRYKQNSFEKALEDFEKALQINSRFAKAFAMRGLVKYNLKRIEEAISDYTESILLNPKLYIAFNNRGNAKLSLGKYREALEDFNQAIMINPNYTISYNNRGAAKINLSRFIDAVNDFDKAINLNPLDSIAYNNRGSAKIYLKMYEDAIIDFNKAIELNNKDAGAYSNRGLAKVALDKLADAINDFNKSVLLNPKDVKSFYNRGAAKGNLGDFDGAKLDFEKATVLYILNNEFDSARVTLRNFEKIKYDCSNIYFYQSLISNLCDEKEKSKADYDKAKELATQQDNKQVLKLLEECFNEDGSLKDNWKEVFKKQSDKSFD